jgi:hypothetical protein
MCLSAFTKIGKTTPWILFTFRRVTFRRVTFRRVAWVRFHRSGQSHALAEGGTLRGTMALEDDHGWPYHRVTGHHQAVGVPQLQDGQG